MTDGDRNYLKEQISVEFLLFIIENLCIPVSKLKGELLVV